MIREMLRLAPRMLASLLTWPMERTVLEWYSSPLLREHLAMMDLARAQLLSLLQLTIQGRQRLLSRRGLTAIALWMKAVIREAYLAVLAQDHLTWRRRRR